MRVLIQRKNQRFPNINYYSAALGFEELGCEVSFVDEGELEEMDAPGETMLVAEIPFMLEAFSRRGVAYEPLRYIPEELLPFAKRRTWRATLGEVRNRVASGESLFAKPLEGTPRLFKGQVMTAYRDLISTANCDAAAPMWCSELVAFMSEYRVFICKKEIVGVKHYLGDFRIFLDWKTVEEAVSRLHKSPAGFAVDFGVTRNGETLIVEQNDGFSLGTYGLHPVTYAKLLEARWNEIVARASAPRRG